MSVKELMNLQAVGTAAVLSKKHMDQGVIDHFAIQTRIMSGIISHPDYSAFAHNTELFKLLKERVEEIVCYVDVSCKANRVVTYPIRYAENFLRNMLEDFGTDIANLVATEKYVPTEEQLYKIFQVVFSKHDLKEY